MAEQNYSNHRRYVPGFHFVLAAVVLLGVVGSLIQLYRAWLMSEYRTMSVLILLLAIAVAQLFWYCRAFALKAQDRAIRAEETLRHYALTGELPDARLGMRQYIGLRFAADEEFPALARRAAEEGMSEDEIKKAVRSWRQDSYRV
jgi:hypothetical protein